MTEEEREIRPVKPRERSSNKSNDVGRTYLQNRGY